MNWDRDPMTAREEAKTKYALTSLRSGKWEPGGSLASQLDLQNRRTVGPRGGGSEHPIFSGQSPVLALPGI